MFKRQLTLFFVGVILFGGPMAWPAPRYHQEVRSALAFLSHYQTSGREGYEPGQWRARVTSYVPSVIGVGRYLEPFEEPTAFVTSSVANILTEIYREDSSYQEIPSLLRKAQESLSLYRWGALFNFYPPQNFKGVSVRGPRFMHLAPQWKGFANIPPDADTTSVTYTFLRAQNPALQLPPAVISALSQARDLHRVPHAYNAAQGQINTGAFLTWLFDEKNPAMPRNIFAAPNKGPRIPFNYNDVDCVVNANVIKMLTVTKTPQGPGYQASCEHLNRVVREKKFYFCGMYYPSFYALPYTLASAARVGASCLAPSRERVVNFLISMQRKDGSWRNSFLARPDFVQSTAWAVNALLIWGDPENSLHRSRVQKGLDFLLSQAQQDDEGRTYWPGQVFFAATFIARYPVVWRSTAYTTALAIKAFVLADRYWGI